MRSFLRGWWPLGIGCVLAFLVFRDRTGALVSLSGMFSSAWGYYWGRKEAQP